jgi:hypothetical protein
MRGHVDHPRLPASEGYLQDMPTEEIDRIVQAALVVIRRDGLQRDLDPRHFGSSLTTTHGLPRWFRG